MGNLAQINTHVGVYISINIDITFNLDSIEIALLYAWKVIAKQVSTDANAEWA